MNRKKETKNPLREALNSLKEIGLDDEIELESGKSVGTSSRPVKKLSEERINTKTGETLKPKRSSKHYDENTTFEQWFDREYDDVEGKFYPFSNYIKVFPNAVSLKNATAKDIIAHAHEFYDVYDVDSVDREKAFEFACDVTGRKYDDFFNAWLNRTPLAESKELRKSGLKEGTAERYINTLKDEWEEMLERGKEPIIEFDNGDYYYIEPDWDNKKFYAGPATNAGILRKIEMQMDPDMNLDEHIAELFDQLIDMDPSLLGDEDPDFTEVVSVIEDCQLAGCGYSHTIEELMDSFGVDEDTAAGWFDDWALDPSYHDTYDDEEWHEEPTDDTNESLKESKGLKEATEDQMTPEELPADDNGRVGPVKAKCQYIIHTGTGRYGRDLYTVVFDTPNGPRFWNTSTGALDFKEGNTYTIMYKTYIDKKYISYVRKV